MSATNMNHYRVVNPNTGEVIAFYATDADGAAIVAALGDAWAIIEEKTVSPLRDAVRRAMLELKHKTGDPRIGSRIVESRIIIPDPTPAARPEARHGAAADELAVKFFSLVRDEGEPEPDEEPW